MNNPKIRIRLKAFRLQADWISLHSKSWKQPSAQAPW